jgi:hypothetical protein
LEHGVTTIPDRVLDDVLDQLPMTPQRRPRWPVRRDSEMSTNLRLGGLAAAVIVLVVAGGALLLGGGRNTGATDSPSPPPSATDPTGTPPPATATPAPAALLPGEFTACVPQNSEFKAGTDARDVVSGADGDVTIDRTRGYTWRGAITATDARFAGTHYYSWDGDTYTLASGEKGQTVWSEGHRIENEEGAWHGSNSGITLPDGTVDHVPTILIGEGGYQGLTAVLMVATDSPCFFDYRGIVTQIPDPPVPFTGE